MSTFSKRYIDPLKGTGICRLVKFITDKNSHLQKPIMSIHLNKNVKRSINRLVSQVAADATGASSSKRRAAIRAHCYQLAVLLCEDGRKMSLKEAFREMNSKVLGAKVRFQLDFAYAEAMSDIENKMISGGDYAGAAVSNVDMFNSSVRDEMKRGEVTRESSSSTRSVTDSHVKSVREERIVTSKPNGDMQETTVRTVSDRQDTKREESVGQAREREQYELHSRTVRKLVKDDSIETLLVRTDEYKSFVELYKKLHADMTLTLRSTERGRARIQQRFDQSRQTQAKGRRLWLQMLASSPPLPPMQGLKVSASVKTAILSFMPVQVHRQGNNSMADDALACGIYGGDPFSVDMEHVDTPCVPLMQQIIVESMQDYDDNHSDVFHPSVIAMRALRPVRAILNPIYRLLMKACGVKLSVDAENDDNYVQARIIERYHGEGTVISFEPAPKTGLVQIEVDTFLVAYDLRRVLGLQELHASAKHHGSMNLNLVMDEDNIPPLPECFDGLERDAAGIPPLVGNLHVAMSIGMAVIFDRTYIRIAEKTAMSRVAADVQFLHHHGQDRLINGYVPPSVELPQYTKIYLEQVCQYKQAWSDCYLVGKQEFDGDETWMPIVKNDDMVVVVANKGRRLTLAFDVMLPSMSTTMVRTKDALGDTWQTIVDDEKVTNAGETLASCQENLTRWVNTASVEARQNNNNRRNGLTRQIFGDDCRKWSSVLDSMLGVTSK